MASILEQIGTKVGEELKALSDRVTTLEGTVPAPTGTFTASPVTWTNLSEINLSGEKLVNGDFSNTTAVADTFTFPTSLGYTNYSTPYPVVEILNSWHTDLTTGNQYDLRTVHIGNEQDPSYAFPTSPNNGHANDHTFAVEDRPLVIALQTTDGLTEGEIYRVHVYNVNSGNTRIYELDGTQVGWMTGRGTKWEVITENTELTNMVLKDTDAGVDKWVGIGAGRGIDWEVVDNEVVDNELSNWSVLNGTLDQTQLANGIIQGDGGAVAIQQTFSQTIPTGTELVLKATRTDTNSGNVRFQPIRADNGVVMSNNIAINPSIGFATYTTPIAISGFKLDTLHGLHEVSSVSIFQGVVSGGSVQTYTGGSIEKISGVGGYNAGASSVQKIDGQKDGYVQFQIASATSSVKIGLVNQDSDFSVEPPWLMNFGGGHIDVTAPFIADHTPYVLGDWFRIRHYSQENEIKFQKREPIYQVNTTSSYEVGTKIMILRDFSSAVKDEIVTVYFVSSSGVPSFEQDDGTMFGAQASITGYGRTDWWEVAESIGEDYVTFYTHPSLSNGSDLYVDTSFYSVGSRINDVQIAIQDS